MDNIKVHVVSYDENTNAVTVFFESNLTSNTSNYVFQMHNVSGSSLIEKLSNIGKSGFYTVDAQVARDQQVANTDLRKAYKALAGNAVGYTREELFPQSSNTVLVSNLTDVTNS